MTSKTNLAAFFLRLMLAATYFSAYSSRLNLFGNHPEGWGNFLKYAAEVNSWAPNSIKFFLAVTATILEVGISVLLLIGFKIRWVSFASGMLTFIFALAMTYSYGIKEPLDYGVFVNFTAAFLLASMPSHLWSVDELLEKRQLKSI